MGVIKWSAKTGGQYVVHFDIRVCFTILLLLVFSTAQMFSFTFVFLIDLINLKESGRSAAVQRVADLIPARNYYLYDPEIIVLCLKEKNAREVKETFSYKIFNFINYL